ncbi:MAG TPA: class I SAM-dependent methyltransferase, partial [Bacteroides sp.]|nr:class I SAM-dependent methyltransferase [Bacteroides sp.]
MAELNAVSETALITLKARVIEAEKPAPLLHDPMGREIMDKLSSLVSTGTQKRVLEKKLKSSLISYLALRARKYDDYTRTFLKENPGGWVVSLGSGFDTRYWRISEKPWKYIEIDLPEVIVVKRKVLGTDPEYEMIGCSVLDDDWIEQVSGRQKQNVLFLAEGLLMYLREADAIGLIKKLAGTFSASQLVFEIIHRKYTKGFRKKLVESKIKGASGT